MEQIGDMKLYTLEEVTDDLIGKPGTPERDEFDSRVAEAVDAWRIGEAIKEERERQNLTQEELGASDDRDKIAIGMAAGGVRAVNKMTAKFVIPWNDKYQWWLDWQKKNRMKKSQYRIFTSHGEHYGSWYVCEEQIPMSDVEEIVNNLTGEVIWRREGGGE